jgi:hypothetical protein
MADTAPVPTRAAPPATPSGNGRAPDWPVQAADTVERFVGTVRDKTAVPLDRVARVIVYGTLGGILLVTSLVLVAIAAVRGLDLAVPGEVWSAHLITGGIFTLGGLFLWSKRSRKPEA